MGGINFFLLEPMGCRITGFRNSVLIREAGGDLIPEGRMSKSKRGRKEYLTHKNDWVVGRLGGRMDLGGVVAVHSAIVSDFG